MATDLEDPEARDRLVDEVLDRTGRIDILVNNAGFADYSVIEDMSFDTFDRTVEHYLRTPFALTRAAIPHMRKQGAGWIVNIGSVTGVAPVRPLPGVQQDVRRRHLRVVQGRPASLHPGGGRRVARCQHRGQLRGAVDGDPDTRCGATDPGCHFPTEPVEYLAETVLAMCHRARRRAHRIGGVQPALSVVAAAAGAQSRRDDGPAAAGAAHDGQSEHPARGAVTVARADANLPFSAACRGTLRLLARNG